MNTQNLKLNLNRLNVTNRKANLLAASTLAISFILSLPAQAMHHEASHSEHGNHAQHNHHMMEHSATGMQDHKGSAKSELTRAEVKRVQAAQGKITLKHDFIPSIDMPPMTMSFTAKNPEMLQGLKRGDVVKFSTTDKLQLIHIEKVE